MAHIAHVTEGTVVIYSVGVLYGVVGLILLLAARLPPERRTELKWRPGNRSMSRFSVTGFALQCFIFSGWTIIRTAGGWSLTPDFGPVAILLFSPMAAATVYDAIRDLVASESVLHSQRPIQSPERTAMSATPPAAQEPRQP